MTRFFSRNNSLVFILGVVLFSLFATFFSLGFIARHSLELPVTGNAPRSGNISISISNELSITTVDDSTIAFPGCYPNKTIYSTMAGGDGAGACPGFVPDSIIVRNDGDILANITINFSNWGEAQGGTFITSDDNSSWIAFKMSNTTTNHLYGGGCLGFLQDSWVNATGSELVVCDALQQHNENNSIAFDIAIHIPANVTSATASTTINFMASESGA